MKFIALLLLIGLSSAASVVQACSCPAPPAPKVAMEHSAAVFSGKAVKVDAGQKDNLIHITFQVSRVWKGDAVKTITLTTNGGNGPCGYSFHEGDSYLVYAYKHEEQLSTNICTRTKPLVQAKEDLDALGEGKPGVEEKPAQEKP